MINTAKECREFGKKLTEAKKKGRTRKLLEQVHTLRRTGQIDDNFSIQSLFEETVPSGREIVREMKHNAKLGSGVFMEAGGDAITTSDFANIIGQISWADTLERFETPDLISGNLMRTRPAVTQQHEIIPGINMIGDRAEAVGENETYPTVGLGNNRIVVPDMVKNGFIVPVTEEAVREDKTGQLMDHVNQALDWLAINQEKERLQTILGITSSFRWNEEAAQATYADSHNGFDFDNLVASNALVDFTDIDTVWNAFDAITDPDTGEPVALNGNVDIIVPRALSARATNVLQAEFIRMGAISATVPLMQAPNPLRSDVRMGGRGYRLWTSQYVKTITSSDTTWFMGQFREAFEDREYWPLQMFVQDRNSDQGFQRDWITAVKVRRKSAPGVRRPWKVAKCTA